LSRVIGHCWKPSRRTLSPPLVRATGFLRQLRGRKSSNKGGLSRDVTVLEIVELQHFRLGDGIFLQSFVLRLFSIVQNSEGRERQLTAQVCWSSNLSRTGESNEARTLLAGPGRFFQPITYPLFGLRRERLLRPICDIGRHQ
jgi:hypothetical protein